MIRRIHKYANYFMFKTGLSLSQTDKFKALIEATKTPAKIQEKALLNILKVNAETEIGKRYNFPSILNPTDYAKAVPIHDYEDLRRLIEAQEYSGEACLTSEQPMYYQRSSGTTSEPKHIPITPTGLTHIMNYQRLAAFQQLKCPDFFQGKIYAVTGSVLEDKMPGNTPIGAASGMIYKQQSRRVKSKYVLPPYVSEIEDYNARYLIMALLGAVEEGVTAISTANPSTLLKILNVLNDNLETVLNSIEVGSIPILETVPSNIRNQINASLKPNEKRSGQLRALGNKKGRLTYQDIWPNLKGIVTWMDGSCRVPLNVLQSLIPQHTKIMELGYVSSEFRGTLNIDYDNNLCIPTLVENYFEFIPRQEWEDGGRSFLGLADIKEELEYYLFITTPDGLYRYDMNDIVKVSGWKNKTPCLSFVRKGQGVTNITGEKLHENQVISAVMDMCHEYGVIFEFFTMIADVSNSEYRLYLEASIADPKQIDVLSLDLNHRLGQHNNEYKEKSNSGRLNPVHIVPLKKGTAHAYRQELVKQGQRDAQFKLQCLQYEADCTFDFAPYVNGLPVS